MYLPWIIVVAVWCVLGRVESASIGEVNRSHDAHMIGGEVVNPKTTRPVIGTLFVRDGKKLIRTCEATLYKRIGPSVNLNYFVTAAECFERGM